MTDRPDDAPNGMGQAGPDHPPPGDDRTVPWGRPDHVMVAVLLGVGLVVLLPNLGDRCLWQDEAECALVARGVLRTGLPRAWDGRLMATGVYGVELTDSFLWAWTPWGMHYLSAAGMALFGQTSFGARIPFALLGCASIGLTYVAARRLVQDRWASCLATVLLITSVQYLLLMRQCRYYAILPVAALLVILGYTELSRRRGVALLAVGMILLFHANYVTAACVGSGLAVHALLWRRDRATWVRLVIAGLVASAFTLPWFFGMGLHHALRANMEVGYAREPAGRAAFKLLFVMNQFVCPFVVVIGLAVAGAMRRLRVGGAYGLVACLAVPVMIVVPFFLWANPRYLVHMLPLGAIVTGAALREVYLRHDVLGNIGAIATGVTNLLPALACAVFPGSVGTDRLGGDFVTGFDALHQGMLKSEWAGYVNELRQPFVGPNEAVTRFLNRNTEPDDVVYATYGQLPIMFHTNRRCAGLLRPASRDRPGWDRLPDYLWELDAANWLVVRPAWRPKEGYDPLLRHWQARARQTGARLAVEKLPVVDIGWGNRPTLRYHYFNSMGPGRTNNVVIVGLQPRDRDRTPDGGAP